MCLNNRPLVIKVIKKMTARKVTKLGAIPVPCPIKAKKDARILKLARRHKRKAEAARAKQLSEEAKAVRAESKRISRIMRGTVKAEPSIVSTKRTSCMVVDRNGFII